jgi:predicted alpha/beta hydrolase
MPRVVKASRPASEYRCGERRCPDHGGHRRSLSSFASLRRGDSRHYYRFIAPALADAGYRVANVDIRGCGGLDRPTPRE